MNKSMQWTRKLAIFILPLLVCINSFAEQLTVEKLEAFSKSVLEATNESPLNISKYLSGDFIIELEAGSRARGAKIFYNRVEYLDMLNKAFENYDQESDFEYDMFDYKVEKSTGQFTIISYSQLLRRKIWNTVYVRQEGSEIKITKLYEKM